MTQDQEIAHRPLPGVLRPVTDELLSSWLVRHAAYYGVTASFFAQWLVLGTRNLCRPLRSCARCWSRHGGPAAQTVATPPEAGRSARCFLSSTNSRGLSSAGLTTRRSQPCPSLFGLRFWPACRAQSPIPPFCTLSETRRSSGGGRRLNASAKKPGSTPMQHGKAIQRENFVGLIFSR